MKNAITASVTTLCALIVFGSLFFAEASNAVISNAACCFVGCPSNQPHCNPCVGQASCGGAKACAPSSCQATRNILGDETLSLAEGASADAERRTAKHTDDFVKESEVDLLPNENSVEDRLQERATQHNPKPNPAGACCKTNCNTIGCTKCAHVLGNTCSHGSCNANECSGASAEDNVHAPVKALEDEHAGVIEDRQGKELKRNLNGGNCCATQCRIPGCHKCGVVYGKTCSYGYCSPGSCSAGVTMEEVLSAEARFLAGESNGVEGDGKMSGHEEETHAATV